MKHVELDSGVRAVHRPCTEVISEQTCQTNVQSETVTKYREIRMLVLEIYTITHACVFVRDACCMS